MDRITVAICTWNRCELLRQTLEQMTKLTIPPEVEWELLVVNNNSTDATDAVIASFTDRLPIRRLFEPMQGHSTARNLALGHFTGEYLIWTDDDVLVDERWLAEYCEAFRRWSEATYFGGTIVPWFEKLPPSWVVVNQQFLEGMLVIRNLGPQERSFARGERPFGANMAFHRSIFAEWRFDPKLGLHGSDRIVGDETALIDYLQDKGIPGIWVPTASVKHFVPAQRLTQNYLWEFKYGLGRTYVRTNGVPEGKVWWGAPRWLYRHHMEQKCNYYWRRLLRDSTWPVIYAQAAETRGEIHECRAHLKACSQHQIRPHCGRM